MFCAVADRVVHARRHVRDAPQVGQPVEHELSTFAYPIPGAGSAEPSGTVPTSPAFEKRRHLKVVPLPSRESSSRRRMSPLCCAAFLSLLYFATVKMRESAYPSLPAAASVCVRKTLLVCG